MLQPWAGGPCLPPLLLYRWLTVRCHDRHGMVALPFAGPRRQSQAIGMPKPEGHTDRRQCFICSPAICDRLQCTIYPTPCAGMAATPMSSCVADLQPSLPSVVQAERCRAPTCTVLLAAMSKFTISSMQSFRSSTTERQKHQRAFCALHAATHDSGL